MIDNDVVVLQNGMYLPKAECSSFTEEYPTYSDVKSQTLHVKVKDLKYAEEEEEEDPLQITCPAVKREHYVSCVCIILVDTCHRYSGLRSICLSDSLSARSNCTVVNGLQQGCTDPVQLNFVTVAPNTCGSLVLKLAACHPSDT